MKQLCLLFLALLVVAALATPSHAVSYTWVGPTGQWSNAANWNPNTGTPGGGTGDYAYVNTGTCTLDSAPTNPIERLFVSSVAGTGVLSIVDGANLQVGVTGANSAYVYSGSTAGAAGAIYQSGGSVTLAKTGTGTMRMANNAAGYGYYGVSGSGTTLSIVGAPMIAALGAGLFEQTGGTVTMNGSVYITNGAAAWGVYDLSAGSASANSANGGFLMSRAGGNATVNVRGTGSLSAKHSIQIGQTSGAGIVNLGAVGVGGGTITAYTVQSPVPGGAFNFHGGTLKAGPTFAEIIAGTTPDSAFITTDVTAYVYNEGAVIDTNGNDAVVSAALIAPNGSGLSSIAVTNGGSGYIAPPIVKIIGGSGTGATAVAQISGGVVTGITITNPGIDYTADNLPTITLEGAGGSGYTLGTIELAANSSGGLRKLGAGELTLGGVNTYTGDTDVEAGSLSLTGSLAGDVNVLASAALEGTGAVGGTVVAAAGSSVGPGTSIGSLTVAGDATLAGVLDVEFDSSTDGIDVLAVSGALDMTGGTIDFSDVAETPVALTQDAYVFATYGSLAGSLPTVTNTPLGYHVDFAYEGNQIALVVPEPSTMLLLVLAGLTLTFWKRR